MPFLKLFYIGASLSLRVALLTGFNLAGLLTKGLKVRDTFGEPNNFP
jgi:hypothetical protein